MRKKIKKRQRFQFLNKSQTSYNIYGEVRGKQIQGNYKKFNCVNGKCEKPQNIIKVHESKTDRRNRG